MNKNINVSNIDLNNLEELYEEDFDVKEKKDRPIHMKFTTEYRHREKTKNRKRPVNEY